MTADPGPTSPSGPPLLEARRLCVERVVSRGGRRRRLIAVDGVSLTLRRGESLGIVGPSGAGKSTLALALLGLIPRVAGEVLLEGRPIGSLPRSELRRRTALVLQDPSSSLDPRQRIGSQIEEPLIVHRLGDRVSRRRRVAELLARMELDARLARRFPHQLSGGQAQRVALARALAAEPDLLVLDEPTTGLDLSIRARVLSLLLELRTGRSLAALVVSHDPSVVGSLCDRTLRLEGGRSLPARTPDAPRPESPSSTGGNRR